MRDLRYPGPIREEPLSVELHNTVFAVNRRVVDGLADERSVAAWLAALGDRVPRSGRGPNPSAAQLRALRDAVRAAIAAALNDAHPGQAVVEALNSHCALAPQVAQLRWRRGERPERWTDFGGASRAALILAALASDTVELLSGPMRSELRACGAPGCVLVFVKDHPRREWCCGGCGNRARQARHYRRRHPSHDPA